MTTITLPPEVEGPLAEEARKKAPHQNYWQLTAYANFSLRHQR